MMNCKCKDIFYISEQKSKIHFISQVNELILKSSKILNKLGISFENNGNIISFDFKNPREFFQENIDCLSYSYNDLEKDEIKIFIENENNKLSLLIFYKLNL